MSFRGSGYLLAPHLVLTAAHMVTPTSHRSSDLVDAFDSLSERSWLADTGGHGTDLRRLLRTAHLRSVFDRKISARRETDVVRILVSGTGPDTFKYRLVEPKRSSAPVALTGSNPVARAVLPQVHSWRVGQCHHAFLADATNDAADFNWAAAQPVLLEIMASPDRVLHVARDILLHLERRYRRALARGVGHGFRHTADPVPARDVAPCGVARLRTPSVPRAPGQHSHQPLLLTTVPLAA